MHLLFVPQVLGKPAANIKTIIISPKAILRNARCGNRTRYICVRSSCVTSSQVSLSLHCVHESVAQYEPYFKHCRDIDAANNGLKYEGRKIIWPKFQLAKPISGFVSYVLSQLKQPKPPLYYLRECLNFFTLRQYEPKILNF